MTFLKDELSIACRFCTTQTNIDFSWHKTERDDRQDYFSYRRSTSRIVIRFLFASLSFVSCNLRAAFCFTCASKSTGGDPRKRDSRRNRSICPDNAARAAWSGNSEFPRFTRNTWIRKFPCFSLCETRDEHLLALTIRHFIFQELHRNMYFDISSVLYSTFF